MIITVFAQKGEQSKTTTALNIMAAAEQPGTLVDLDVLQGDSMKFAGSMPGVEFTNKLHWSGKQSKGLIVIDTPPTVNTVVMEALRMSDMVICPCTPYQLSLEALERTFETIELAREKNDRLIARVLFTRVDRTQFTSGVITGTRVLSMWPVLQAEIPQRKTEFEKAVAKRCPVILNSRAGAGAVAYRAAVQELFKDAK
jgi:cellulose biosynthesis protein BcsQ